MWALLASGERKSVIAIKARWFERGPIDRKHSRDCS